MKHDQAIIKDAEVIDVAILLKETIRELRDEMDALREREMKRDIELIEMRRERDALRRELAQNSAQALYAQMAQAQNAMANQMAQQSQLGQQAAMEFHDCTCVPGRAAALREEPQPTTLARWARGVGLMR
jgi:regulator of replication initiation timing